MKQLIVLALIAACSGSSKPTAEPAPPGDNGSASGSAVAPGPDDGNCTDPKPAADSICQQDCGPPVAREGDPIPGWRWVSPADAKNRADHGCPICLPPDAMIATPSGEVPVSELVAGAIVWSTDQAGRRVAAPVVRVGSTATPRDHALVVITLADGREVTGSPGHPTADARLLGNVVVGDSLDGAKIVEVHRRPFGQQRTFDLLPAGPTRAYWANGVLVSSTLR